MHVAPPPGVHDDHVGIDGVRYHRISGYHRLPPFLVPVVGVHDMWLFLSSSGGLTAGRGRPDQALFPYVTEDKLADTAGVTGGVTVVRTRRSDGRRVRWEPLSPAGRTDPRVSRAAYKDALSSTVILEEVREDLGLRFREVWRTSGTFGVVRESRLAALDGGRHELSVLDGLLNLLPAGVGVRAQQEYSVLIDAYKRARLDPGTGLATYWMGSELTDRAEPREALLATVCWRLDAPGAQVLLSADAVDGHRTTGELHGQRETRGRRGAYLVGRELVLDGAEERSWRIVADTGLDAAAVVDLRERLRAPDEVARDLTADLTAGRDALVDLVGRADGAQACGHEATAAHHLANVLFNAMRGGTFAEGYTVRGADMRAFVEQRSPRTARRCARRLADLPPRLHAVELYRRAALVEDPDLHRLLTEYLPLSWGRRHGDPSRPWNTFEIAPYRDGGVPQPDFQGNWRDVFQNWEALGWSFPEYLESMVATFLSATTVDGYNPYRISRSGIAWERPAPDEPWSNIGYWSDHQIVYLLALLRLAQRFHPGRVTGLLHRRVFTHADVPYRIRSHEQIVADPRSTIDYDAARAEASDRRVMREGADGRLLSDADGELIRVTGVEKLLTLLLAKLVNLVPGAGIWMNTQRPEWNDANNALVGQGVSVVTLAQLRSYLVALPDLLAVPAEGITLGEEVADLLDGVLDVLSSLGDVRDDDDRRRVMDRLGGLGSDFRDRVYAGPGGRSATVPAARVTALLDTALAVVEDALRANRRPDGLFHSYNLLDLKPESASVRHLPLMLEGQVAVLASGLLSTEESLEVLRALRASSLYRPDRGTYQLYPDRSLPGFVERNVLPPETVARCPLIGLLVERGDRSVVVRDVTGDHHFAGGMANAGEVRLALTRLGADPALARAVRRDGETLLEIYEQVFRHREFTGRSGSFFGYEGLGSVYWHMVAKLQLTVLETYRRAVDEGAEHVATGLAQRYRDVRAGLGFTRSCAEFGAFPTDPHSHTPAGGGARQPGMTGQVKESILARFGELGLLVRDGRIVFVPPLLAEDEWAAAPTRLDYPDVAGHRCSLPVPADALAFTFCQVPVLYRNGGGPGATVPTGDGPLVTVHQGDGSRLAFPGGVLDPDLSAAVFRRDGRVRLIEVLVPGHGHDAAGRGPGS